MFKTTDDGRTWTSVASNLPPGGHVNVVREDRYNRDLLFVGTEPGKLADIIMVDGDPLANIANVRRVKRVIANGRPFDLDQLVKGGAGR